MQLSETFRYLYSYSGKGLNSLESQLKLTVVLGFLHSLYTLPEVIVPISGVYTLKLSGISTVSKESV